MKSIKGFLLSIVIALASLVPLAVPLAYADTPVNDACNAINADPNCGTTSGPSVTAIVKTVIKILSIVVGIVAVIMIIIAGLKYITSGGDASSVASAKNTLLYSIVGLVIAISAYAIVGYVLQTV